jgi:excisionase family DNA binding protein
MSALRNEQLIAPPASRAERELARASSRLLAASIGKEPTARLRVVDGDQIIEVPVAALRMLVDILANMAAGNAMSLVPIHAELTTQQAADFLNVSRPYFIGLLERGELAHHKVGTHRRVYFRDLQEYRRVSHEKALQALADMTAEAQKMGLYD